MSPLEKPRDILQAIHDGKISGNVSVPCNGCTACCKSSHVTVQLTKGEADRLPLHREHDGRMVLQKRADGACIYLDSDNRCSVYHERPAVCRLYDCRLWAIVGVTPVGDPDWAARIDSWVFDLSDVEDASLVAELRGRASRVPKGKTIRDYLAAISESS